MQPAAPPLDVTPEELEALLESVRQALGEAGYQKLKAAIRTLGYLAELLRERDITLDGLRELLLSPAGASTEKTRQVLQNAGIETQKQNQEKQNSQASQRSRPGHGRHGVDAYSGAQKVKVPHPSLHPGDRCPECSKGKVYVLEAPGVLVRLVGQAPITGTVYELEKLRCNLCLQVFTAEAPAGVGEEKYDVTSASMMALLKYGSGMPFHRLEGLQGKPEIPLPASTQWGIMKETAERIEPASIAMSIWAFACSSDNCLDPLRSPREPVAATHSAEAQQESSHFDFGELRTRSCHVLLIRRIGDRMSLTPSFIPSLSDVERYKRLRRLARDLNHRIVKTVPREAMHEVGETIGILHRGVLVFDTLVFDTEDETSI